MDMSGKSDARRRGYAARSKVLGDEYVERAFGEADDFTQDLQDYLTEHTWGASWGRGGLDFKTRSLLNLGYVPL